jgi:hypothetical protein
MVLVVQLPRIHRCLFINYGTNYNVIFLQLQPNIGLNMALPSKHIRPRTSICSVLYESPFVVMYDHLFNAQSPSIISIGHVVRLVLSSENLKSAGSMRRLAVINLSCFFSNSNYHQVGLSVSAGSHKIENHFEI